MATKEIMNGETIRVNTTEQGTIYSKNFRSMLDECRKAGTTDFRVNRQTHAFFLGGKSYYVGPSLQGKSVAEIVAVGKDIQICDSSLDKEKWVPSIFLPKTGEGGSFEFAL